MAAASPSSLAFARLCLLLGLRWVPFTAAAPKVEDPFEEDELPIDFSVFTRGQLANSLVGASVDDVRSWQQEWAAATIPGYSSASRLAKYAVDGRGRFWMSRADSKINQVGFQPYKWTRVDSPWDATICWLSRKSHIRDLEKHHEDDDDVREFPYLVNRVENAVMVTDKSNLPETLAGYTVEGRGPATFLQTPTHVIRSAEDCMAFLASWGPSERSSTWVHKLADESQGHGIAFFPPGAPHPPCNESGEYRHDVVVQRHIDFPFTLSGKKSEIRAYWVVASVEPLIVLLYHTGTVRLATNDYIPPSKSTLDDWGNPLVHVLNTRQQKIANPDYELTANERKRTWATLPQTLREQGRIPAEMTDDEWIQGALFPALNVTVHALARSLQPKIQDRQTNPLGGANRRYDLYGLDIIFEDVAWREREGQPNHLGDGGTMVEPGGLRIWVTEAQVGPGLSLDASTKIEVLPPMITEFLNTVLEIDDRRLRGRRLDTVGEVLQNFSVVINDATADWKMPGAGDPEVQRAPMAGARPSSDEL